MPHFMIVLILYINLSNLSWIKQMSIFEEYGSFKPMQREMYSFTNVIAVIWRVSLKPTGTPIFVHLHYENMPIQIYWDFTTKNWKFSDKKFWYCHISAQNIDSGYSEEPPRRGGFNEYPQSMFLNRNKKNNEYPCKPQFYYIKVGFKGVKII